MPKEELPVVSLLLRRQSHHPLLEGFPTAARIADLPLFLGEAGAAQDAAFLEANNIQAIVALGTGNLAAKPCDVLLIDILDMEDELLLPRFEECIEYLKKHILREEASAPVLVHCVYGQSRSASICVAYLMATQNLTLLEAYDVVQKARPCISINPGFLRQLELFGRMGNDPDIMGSTPAHAELRTMVARHQRMKTGVPDVVTTPQLTLPGNSICCKKCNYVLCTTRNQLAHASPDTTAIDGTCACIFIEPMQWMTKDAAFVRNNDGKLLCPSCKAKLGSWNWIGVNWYQAEYRRECFRPNSVLAHQNGSVRTRLFRRNFSMGAAASSATTSTIADNSSLPNALAVLTVAQTINKTGLKQLTLTSQREFHLSAKQLHTLFASVAKDSVDQAFAVFDSKRSGVVDSCELLATLILVAELPRDTKQRAIFELFNVSTHRVGLMVADEATLLFRTVAAGAAKVLCALGSTSQTVVASELPRMPFFEDLTKTLYGEQETITYEVFAQLCRDTAEVNTFIQQWAFDSE